MGEPRKYPFGERVPVPGTTTSASNSIPAPRFVYIETQKPNPFHGIDRYIFAFDEWGHRHNLNARGPLRWLCNWWVRRLWSRDDG